MFETILYPFELLVSWVWFLIHRGLVFIGLPSGSGIAWVLSIILLTVLIRLATVPLYLKQIRSSRSMQALQPELKKLQAKYKGKTDPASKQRQMEEQQALFKKHGTSPFASCMPMLVQMPVLFAMYRTIYAVKLIADGTYTYHGQPSDHLGPITADVAKEIDLSTVAGVSLSTQLSTAPTTSATLTFIALIVIMVVLQFWSMRMMLVRNTPPSDDPNNPMVRSQKTMMYIMPLLFIATGFIFQMGVLVYMVTGAVWMLLQQMWVLKVMPTPGSLAFQDVLTKRQTAYQEWARPLFLDYENKRSLVASSEEELAALNRETLKVVQAKAKKSAIPSNFPESLSDGEILSIYRNLSNIEWTTLPDDMWMSSVHRQTEQAAERRAQAERRGQLQRQKKHQRPATPSLEGSAPDTDAIRAADERERRRQERRKAERERRRRNRS